MPSGWEATGEVRWSSRWAASTRCVNLLLAKNPPCKYKKTPGPSLDSIAFTPNAVALIECDRVWRERGTNDSLAQDRFARSCQRCGRTPARCNTKRLA